ncbi:MAG: MSMEG_4193 family putative phosphomutase [Chloroflexota bacterium]|jgi:probable phosphoglycerate mutase
MAYALLIRHAQNDWVKKKRLAGWTPGVHLNDVGRKQAEQLAGRLSQLPLKAIYSSPLERCLETATAITAVHSLEIQEIEAIGEVRYGKWQGKKIKKLSKKPAWHIIQHYPSRFRFPEGESLLEVQQRAVSAIEELAQKHKDEVFAIVSHADVIKLALAHYLGMHVDLFQRLVVSPASVSLVALPESGIIRVLRVNDHGPIEPPPKPERDEKKSQNESESEAPGKEKPPEHHQSHDGPPLANHLDF